MSIKEKGKEEMKIMFESCKDINLEADFVDVEMTASPTYVNFTFTNTSENTSRVITIEKSQLEKALLLVTPNVGVEISVCRDSSNSNTDQVRCIVNFRQQVNIPQVIMNINNPDMVIIIYQHILTNAIENLI